MVVLMTVVMNATVMVTLMALVVGVMDARVHCVLLLLLLLLHLHRVLLLLLLLLLMMTTGIVGLIGRLMVLALLDVRTEVVSGRCSSCRRRSRRRVPIGVQIGIRESVGCRLL